MKRKKKCLEGITFLFDMSSLPIEYCENESNNQSLTIQSIGISFSFKSEFTGKGIRYVDSVAECLFAWAVGLVAEELQPSLGSANGVGFPSLELLTYLTCTIIALAIQIQLQQRGLRRGSRSGHVVEGCCEGHVVEGTRSVAGVDAAPIPTADRRTQVEQQEDDAGAGGSARRRQWNNDEGAPSRCSPISLVSFSVSRSCLLGSS
ncbi:hypothetical protein LXL04_015420 [Taraxacum kok-saghyz]